MARGTKLSRKGKKEWRRNISTEDHEQFLDKKAQDERTGGSLEDVANEEIFFLDKKKDVVTQRKVDKWRNRVLHSDSILSRASLMEPIAKPVAKKRPATTASSTKGKKQAVNLAGNVASKRAESSGLLDPWGDEDLSGSKRVMQQGDENATQLSSQVVAPAASTTPKQKHVGKSTGANPYVPGNTYVPAVEVDVPGCSFNPSFEEHQDAVAAAVAEEVQRGHRAELGPTPPSLTVTREEREREEEEAVKFFLVGGEEEEGEGEEEEDEGEGVTGSRRVVNKKLTKADLNRRARREAAEDIFERKKELKRLRRDIDRVKAIAVEVEVEARERQQMFLRKQIAKLERQMRRPPRLGRHKFQPEPISVLTSDEVTGSLRQLKGNFLLLRDRYKSLQRRGVIEPRVAVKRRAARNRRMVVQGSKGEKEREMHDEISQIRAERRASAKRKPTAAAI